MKKINFVFGYIYIVLSLFLFSFDLLSEGIVKETLNSRYDISRIYVFGNLYSSDLDSLLLPYSKVKSENELLKKEISTLQNRNNSNIELEKEIKELKTILQYQSNANEVILVTKILGFETFPLKRVIVDIGENRGVSSGDIVLDAEGRVVGMVKYAFPMYSEVSLITSSDFTINAVDSDTNRFILFNKDEQTLLSRSIENLEQDIFSGVLTTSRIFNHGGEFPIARITEPLLSNDGITGGAVEIISDVYNYKYFQIVIRELGSTK
tara:strand:- start:89 stop:883 length:795 start_codon:yes stop_codon:yes gene_type:complete